LNDDGTFNESILIPYSKGPTSVSYEYEFDFTDECKNTVASSCSDGTFKFECSGKTTIKYGRMSGITLCGDVAYYGGQNEETEDLHPCDFSYYVSGPSSYGFFSGDTTDECENTLYYYANPSMVNDRHINIIATLNEDNTKYRGEMLRCECTLASTMKWKCKISDK
jgi:hypothetical protein